MAKTARLCAAASLALPLLLAARLALPAGGGGGGGGGGQAAGSTSDVRCLNNYGFQPRRVDCTWRRNLTTGEGTFYLNFSDTSRLMSGLLCWLSASSKAPDEFHCSTEGPGNFEENDEYRVSLRVSLGKGVVYTAWEDIYEPMRNIKCDPPTGVWSNMSAGRCLIMWQKPEAYEIIWEALQWQLQFRPTLVPWEQAESKTVVSRETWMEIDSSEFIASTRYAARVRCKTPDSSNTYISQWSEWSTSAEWSTPPGPLQREDSLVQAAILVSVPLCLGALLFLLSSFYSRIKSHCSARTPNPAAFFSPLYASHSGNFQAWTGLMEREVWLRCSGDAGPGMETPSPLEAISWLSSIKHLSGGEQGWSLPGAPGQLDKSSDYVAMQGEAEALSLPGGSPLYVEGLNAAGWDLPYFPYKNYPFAEEAPQETEIGPACSKAPCPLGMSTCSVVPM